MTNKSFVKLVKNNINHLCVTVTKTSTTLLTINQQSFIKHMVGIGFQVKSGLHKPLFWLKWSMVVNMLKMLKYDDKHPALDYCKQVYVRKNAGGPSFRLKNSKNYPEHQMFIMLKSDVDQDWKQAVELVVDHVKDFLTCPVFQSQYMETILAENWKLHAYVAKDENENFKAFNQMDIVWLKELSLNEFLIDEDIKDEMSLIYGQNFHVDDLDEDVKEFCFIDGDASNFGISDVANGTSTD